MKVKIDEPTAGAEVSKCDDCQYYKMQKDMDGEVFHFCTEGQLTGFGRNGAKRMRYKMGTCSFYSKDKKEFDWDAADFPKAYIAIRERAGKNSKSTRLRFLSPGEYHDYVRKRPPFGM